MDLQDKDAVRGAPLLQVVENLGVAMSKHYLSALLPSTTKCSSDHGDCSATVLGFDGKKRAEWVEEIVASASIGEACEQWAFYRRAAQHR